MTDTNRPRIRLQPNVIHQTVKALNLPSRDELARRMNVSTATAYRVEMGKVDPSPAFIAALMIVSGKEFADLFRIVTEEVAA